MTDETLLELAEFILSRCPMGRLITKSQVDGSGVQGSFNFTRIKPKELRALIKEFQALKTPTKSKPSSWDIPGEGF